MWTDDDDGLHRCWSGCRRLQGHEGLHDCLRHGRGKRKEQSDVMKNREGVEGPGGVWTESGLSPTFWEGPKDSGASQRQY